MGVCAMVRAVFTAQCKIGRSDGLVARAAADSEEVLLEWGEDTNGRNASKWTPFKGQREGGTSIWYATRVDLPR